MTKAAVEQEILPSWAAKMDPKVLLGLAMGVGSSGLDREMQSTD
jgi:hypothetical protein